MLSSVALRFGILEIIPTWKPQFSKSSVLFNNLDIKTHIFTKSTSFWLAFYELKK